MTMVVCCSPLEQFEDFSFFWLFTGFPPRFWLPHTCVTAGFFRMFSGMNDDSFGLLTKVSAQYFFVVVQAFQKWVDFYLFFFFSTQFQSFLFVAFSFSLFFFFLFFFELRVVIALAVFSRPLFIKNLFLFSALGGILLFSNDLLQKTLLKNIFIARRYQSFVMFLFFFLLFSNLVGLIPYVLTLTSQLILTFGISFFLFFAINFVSWQIHGINFLSFFLPSGTPFIMVFLLVPIEIISYFARVFSLAIRLFANMMAGHCLLKILAGFGWDLINAGLVFCFVAAVVPFLIILCVVLLETLIAFLQAYVFVLLFMIYLKDAIWLH